MVSQYQNKNHHFMQTKSRLLEHPIVVEAHGLIGLLQAKRGYARSRITERIVTWELIFWNVGVKIRRNRPT